MRPLAVLTRIYCNYIFFTDSATNSEHATGIEDLDPDTQRDLKRQLERNRRSIQNKYAIFAVSLCNAVIAIDVTLTDFKLYLLGLPAFESGYEDEQPILLDYVKVKIENAETFHKIFNVLTTECCSFINVGIFESILDSYGISTDSDNLQYCKHLQAYLKNHKISEFIMLNPRLERFAGNSEKLILKFNVDLPSKITKVLDLKGAIADILGVRSYALQLIGIKRGCVVVTFLIPASTAANIFASGLTAKQEADIRALSVLWLECGDYKLEETPHDTTSIDFSNATPGNTSEH